jgi:hypothetical protein
MQMRKLAIGALLVLAISSLLWAQKQPQNWDTTHNTDAAQQSAQSWMALVDKGDYAGSYDQASSTFKTAIGKDDWVQKLRAGRAPLGKVVSRKLKSADFTTQLPGAPDGQYVVIQYDTSFENKQSAVETIVPMVDKKDRQWRTSGYFVK